MRSNPIPVCALFLATLWLGAPPAIAAEAAPASSKTKTPAHFIRNAPLPKWIVPLAAVPAVSQAAPVVVRLAEVQAWAGPNPAVLVNRAVQVNDKTRLGEIGQYGVSYYPAYQKLYLHRVAILRGGQVMDRTATVNTRLLEREPSLERGFYVGETTVQLLLDDVRAGDTLHITYTTEGRNPVFGKPWADEFSWDHIQPIEHKRLVISHPAGQPLRWRELGDAGPPTLQPVVEQSGAVTRLRFEGTALKAFEPEQGIPSDFLPVRMIQASEYASWQEVAAWAAGLFAAPPASPEVAALARQFAAGKTEEEKASAALHWVQDEIRYFSVALGENSHRPQLPDAVLKRRFGDCKDKTGLLIALLAQLGIKAEPVLVYSRAPAMPARLLPSPSWFDHVIVRLQADGKTYFVDPTREGEKGLLSRLPTAIPGAAGLVASEASTALLALPEEQGGTPWMETQEKFIVGDIDGDAQLDVRHIYRGAYARHARVRYAAMAAADLRRDMLGDYDKQFRGATLVETPRTEEGEEGGAFSVSARFKLPKPVVLEDGWYALQHKTHIMDGTLGIPDKLARTLPFEMPMGLYEGRYRLRIVWPEHVKLGHSGDARTIDNPFFRAHKEYSWRGNEVDYVIDYAIKRKQLQAAELPELETQSRLLFPLIESTLRFNAESTVQPKAQHIPLRDATSSAALGNMRLVAEALSRPQEMKESAATIGILCNAALDGTYLGAIAPGMRQASGSLLRMMESFKGLEAEKAYCKGQFAFQVGDYKEALAQYAKTGPVKDDDALLLDLAWARKNMGDAAGAMADVQRFLQANLKAGTLSPNDAVLALLLLQRGGVPPGPELEAYLGAVPDAPWPRPLLAFLAGKLSQQELLQTINAFSPSKRESALNDAWFYIASRLRLDGKDEQALQALRWYRLHGVFRSRSDTLARGELAQLAPSDPDLKKGVALTAAKSPDFRLAREHYLKAAARGVAAAETELGFLARYGKVDKADPAAAFAWYERAAQHGDQDGMNNLGAAYEDGIGVAANAALAAQWYQRAAVSGHYFASRNLGRFYRAGLGGLPVDKKLALQYFYDAAQLGNAEAQGYLAHMYFHAEGTAQDWVLALYWAARAAENGDPDATAMLAFMKAYGHGTPQDLPKAIALWQKAADDGSEAAQVQLGNAYQQGRGVPKDEAKALAWFLKAAKQGNQHASTQVAIAYLYGEGIPAEPAKARTLFNALRQDKVPDGDYWLGKMAEKGLDGAADPALAERHYRQCAELGDEYCQFALGASLQFGKAGAPNPKEAMAWYGKAVAQGNAPALTNLADMHEKGTGTAVNLPLAVTLYRKAAQKGNGTALFSLGELNESGKGMPANAYLAYVYYGLAAKSEQAGDAAAGLKRVAARLSAEQIARANQVAGAWTNTQPLPAAAATAAATAAASSGKDAAGTAARSPAPVKP